MAKKQKSYTEEFKVQIVELHNKAGKGITELWTIVNKVDRKKKKQHLLGSSVHTLAGVLGRVAPRSLFKELPKTQNKAFLFD